MCVQHTKKCCRDVYTELNAVFELNAYCMPRVSIGLFCSTPGIAVARAVPRKVAMEMLLTGHPISAHGMFNSS